MSIIEGGTFEFSVVCKNSRGTQIIPTDAAVALSDPAAGSVSVGADGKNGVFTSSGGPTTVVLTPSASGVTGAAYSLEVTADLVITSVEIVANPPATVEVVPA
jgi:hypothetical protein